MDRRPLSAPIAEFRIAQNAHFSGSRERTRRYVVTRESSSLANRGYDFQGWPIRRRLDMRPQFSSSGTIDSHSGQSRCCVVFGVFLCQN